MAGCPKLYAWVGGHFLSLWKGAKKTPPWISEAKLQCKEWRRLKRLLSLNDAFSLLLPTSKRKWCGNIFEMSVFSMEKYWRIAEGDFGGLWGPFLYSTLVCLLDFILLSRAPEDTYFLTHLVPSLTHSSSWQALGNRQMGHGLLLIKFLKGEQGRS